MNRKKLCRTFFIKVFCGICTAMHHVESKNVRGVFSIASNCDRFIGNVSRCGNVASAYEHYRLLYLRHKNFP